MFCLGFFYVHEWYWPLILLFIVDLILFLKAIYHFYYFHMISWQGFFFFLEQSVWDLNDLSKVWKNLVNTHIHTPQIFIHSSINGHLSCFQMSKVYQSSLKRFSYYLLRWFFCTLFPTFLPFYYSQYMYVGELNGVPHFYEVPFHFLHS